MGDAKGVLNTQDIASLPLGRRLCSLTYTECVIKKKPIAHQAVRTTKAQRIRHDSCACSCLGLQWPGFIYCILLNPFFDHKNSKKGEEKNENDVDDKRSSTVSLNVCARLLMMCLVHYFELVAYLQSFRQKIHR